jgi:O-antigen ligase
MSSPGILYPHSPRLPATAVRSATPVVPVQADAVAALAEERDLTWDFLLVCLAGYILTSVGRLHQLFPALGLVRPTVVAGILGIATYLLDSRDERRAYHLLVPTTKFLVMFFLWMVLSVPGALRPGASFELVFDNFIKSVLMYLVVAGGVRGVRDIERLMFAYLIGAVVYAAVVLMRFDVGAGDTWRLGHLYYYDANDLATFLVTAMPFGLHFLHSGRWPMQRVFAMVGLAVITIAFVRSGSRGGFIAVGVVLVFIVFRYRTIPLRWRVSGAALVTVFILGTASDQYWEQMGTILSDTDYNHTEESGRLQIWNRGVGYMLRNPVLGLGPDNFPTAEGTLSPFAERQQLGIGVRWNAAHNSFVQVGAELGFPGLVFFIAIIVSTFSALHRSGQQERALAEAEETDQPGLTPALTASLLGFVVGSVFLSLAYSEMLYTLVALAIGLHKVTAARSDVRRLEAQDL